jgi:hypothetical protein
MDWLKQAVACVGVAVLLGGCATSAPPPPPATWDGLEYRPGHRTGALYVRPGGGLRTYRTVMIDPLVVAIDDDWRPYTSSLPAGRGVAPDHLSDSEIQHIKDRIAGEFGRIFRQELTAGGYQIVERPGDDTVHLSPGLADVYMESGYGGRMTLVLQLRDAPTGQLLARLVDRKEGEMGLLQSPDSVTENVSFRRAIKAWAREARVGLDQLGRQAP